jgi:hypothetical protein
LGHTTGFVTVTTFAAVAVAGRASKPMAALSALQGTFG